MVYVEDKTVAHLGPTFVSVVHALDGGRRVGVVSRSGADGRVATIDRTVSISPRVSEGKGLRSRSAAGRLRIGRG